MIAFALAKYRGGLVGVGDYVNHHLFVKSDYRGRRLQVHQKTFLFGQSFFRRVDVIIYDLVHIVIYHQSVLSVSSR